MINSPEVVLTFPKALTAKPHVSPFPPLGPVTLTSFATVLEPSATESPSHKRWLQHCSWWHSGLYLAIGCPDFRKMDRWTGPKRTCHCSWVEPTMKPANVLVLSYPKHIPLDSCPNIPITRLEINRKPLQPSPAISRSPRCARPPSLSPQAPTPVATASPGHSSWSARCSWPHPQSDLRSNGPTGRRPTAIQNLQLALGHSYS